MAEDKYPKTIKVNGQDIIVNSKEEEKQARSEAKENNVEIEYGPKNQPLQEDVTAEESSQTSTEEIDPSQNNQQQNIELSPNDGSLELVKEKIKNEMI